jgi:hypothetical protein
MQLRSERVYTQPLVKKAIIRPVSHAERVKKGIEHFYEELNTHHKKTKVFTTMKFAEKVRIYHELYYLIEEQFDIIVAHRDNEFKSFTRTLYTKTRLFLDEIHKFIYSHYHTNLTEPDIINIKNTHDLIINVLMLCAEYKLPR